MNENFDFVFVFAFVLLDEQAINLYLSQRTVYASTKMRITYICFTREGLEPLPVFLKPHCYSGDKYSNKKKSDKIGVRYGFSSIYLSQV